MSLNPDLQAKLDSATEHYEALLASERDQATYLLATMICDTVDPGQSIAGLRPEMDSAVQRTQGFDGTKVQQN